MSLGRLVETLTILDRLMNDEKRDIDLLDAVIGTLQPIIVAGAVPKPEMDAISYAVNRLTELRDSERQELFTLRRVGLAISESAP